MTAIDSDRQWLGRLRRVVEAARRSPPQAAAGVAVRRWPAALGDYLRDYAPGDDYRAIDWRLAARHDELRVAIAPRPATRTIEFLLDASGSMAAGRSPKWPVARQAAAMLGALALAAASRSEALGPSWRARMASYSDRILRETPPQSDPVRWAEHVLAMELAQPRRSGDFARAAEQFARRIGWGDELWVVTDGFDADNLLVGMARLQGGGRRLGLLHLVDPADREPGLVGDVELVDAETGVRRRATLTPRLLDRFRATYDGWLARLHRGCRAAGIAVCVVPADADFAELVRRVEPWGGR